MAALAQLAQVVRSTLRVGPGIRLLATVVLAIVYLPNAPPILRSGGDQRRRGGVTRP